MHTVSLTDYDVILFVLVVFFISLSFFNRDTTYSICDYGANVGASVMWRFLLTPRIILRGAGRSRFVLGLICHSSRECVYVFLNIDGRVGVGGGLMVDSTGFYLFMPLVLLTLLFSVLSTYLLKFSDFEIVLGADTNSAMSHILDRSGPKESHSQVFCSDKLRQCVTSSSLVDSWR